jgi:hypothetical protein
LNDFNIEIIPDEPNQLPPARRRRRRRLLAPLDIDDRTAFLDELAHRVSPSFDFYLFSLACGVIVSLGLVFDIPPFLLVGTLLAPLMAPVIGLSLGMITGSISYFLRSLLGLCVGCALIFTSGLLAGLAAKLLAPLVGELYHIQANYHTQLSWLNFLVLTIASIWTTLAIMKDVHRATLPNVALAYELYVPLAAAGLGMTSSYNHLWPDGLIVFALHLCWAVVISAVVFGVHGFRPLTLFGYTLSGAVALFGIILVIGMLSAGLAIGGGIALPTPVPSPTKTPTLTPTPSPTPVPPTATLTPTYTSSPSATLTLTPFPSSTPHYAMVSVVGSTGAYLRSTPGGEIIKSYLNGTIVEILPEIEMVSGMIWVRIKAPDGTQGWVLQSLLIIPMPTPAN